MPRRLVIAYHEERSELAELLDGGEVTVGRSREARLTLASEEVSRLHARLRRRGEVVTVEDLGSRNGTFVDGARVEGETVVGPGQAVTVGPATLVLATMGRAGGAALEGFDALLGAIAAECVRARATGRRAALILLRIDGRPDAVGGAQAVALARLRAFDRAAAYGPYELCVLRPEDASADAARAAEGLLAAVAAVEGARGVAGIAAYPEDATDPDRLLGLAREAMRAAAREGPAIVRAGTREAATRSASASGSGSASASASGSESGSVSGSVSGSASASGSESGSVSGSVSASGSASRSGSVSASASVTGSSAIGAVGRGMRAAARAAPADPEPIAADSRTRQTLALCGRVAPTPLTVLLLGETGVGKEVVARQIHRLSRRAAGPFVAVNCAALPESLLESELFGHERGAFTGAVRRKEGYFERAVGGTLLLDEIGDLGPDLQAKLLRAIERKTIVRVGGGEEIDVDVRLVAATHHDLDAAVRAGTFRADLWYRLSVFVLAIPPLRERPADVEPLARLFLAEMAAEMGGRAELSAPALAALRAHDWPGNVRELRNVMERALVLAGGGVIGVEHLPGWAADAVGALPAGAAGGVGSGAVPEPANRIEAMERAAIVEALAACGGNQTRAAQLLGLTRRALIYRMEKHGLKARPAGDPPDEAQG
jgi:DNA-binding NtrC family response regulator